MGKCDSVKKCDSAKVERRERRGAGTSFKTRQADGVRIYLPPSSVERVQEGGSSKIALMKGRRGWPNIIVVLHSNVILHIYPV